MSSKFTGVSGLVVANEALEAAQMRAAFLEAMCRVAAPISVVVTDGPAGRYGVTVSAVASVCADPPTILVCINRRSPVVHAILSNGFLTVNLLSAEQSAIAETFAGRTADGLAFDFSCGQWSDDGIAGAQHLKNAAATMHAAFQAAHDYGTHAIIIAKVLAVQCAEHESLVYLRRTYGRVVAPKPPG